MDRRNHKRNDRVALDARMQKFATIALSSDSALYDSTEGNCSNGLGRACRVILKNAPIVSPDLEEPNFILALCKISGVCRPQCW